MSKWTTVWSAADLAGQYKLTAGLDPWFAKQQREFWESRTATQLRVLADQAWQCNDSEGNKMARSYAALKGGK